MDELKIPERLGVTRNTAVSYIQIMILLIILVVLVLLSFGGGVASPTYRTHGISVGTILLIVLVLWVLGVFGSRPF